MTVVVGDLYDIFVKGAQPLYSLSHNSSVKIDRWEVIITRETWYLPKPIIVLNRYDNPLKAVWFEDGSFSEFEFDDFGVHFPVLFFKSG